MFLSKKMFLQFQISIFHFGINLIILSAQFCKFCKCLIHSLNLDTVTHLVQDSRIRPVILLFVLCD